MGVNFSVTLKQTIKVAEFRMTLCTEGGKTRQVKFIYSGSENVATIAGNHANAETRSEYTDL